MVVEGLTFGMVIIFVSQLCMEDIIYIIYKYHFIGLLLYRFF